MLRPCAVNLTGWPEGSLAGGDPRLLVAHEDPTAALDHDEPGRVGARVRLDPRISLHRELGDRAAPVAVDDLRAAGVTLVGEVEVQVQDGKIVAFRYTLDDATLQKLQSLGTP